jgi:glycosyltransferase involved in cell wall biosynthesis
VPVIASRVGGLPELIDDGQTGFLSAVGDVDKMADDASRLLIDAKLRKEVGKRARASAIERYSTHRIIPAYIEFYERILAAAVR